jgi:N12 class adenine-specific DNA methylase/adenine-specific DNA methylase
MARKYDFISELYNRTCQTVVSGPASWEAFLRSACRNYKLRFDEQLLVFAQRPDATAVLPIERWNESFGRWVNKGAHGIAVFEDADRKRQRLVHYFDISDTHESRFSRPVPIWQMKDEYTADVIDTLESTFGELDSKETLPLAIESAARNAVEDNLPDYLTDLLYSVEGSFLDGVSEEEITHIFKTAVRNSVAYMTMTRLSIDAGEYFEPDDLRDVVNFTTPQTLNYLGYATSDIAEMGLAEISRTILALDRQNRTFAESHSADYNKENKTERSPGDERDHLHDAGGLPASRSDDAGAAGTVDGQVRPDAEEVPEGAPQGALLQPSDELHPERASERNGAESHRAGAEAGPTDGADRGRDGEPENSGYDELGSEDEQHPEPGTGDRADGDRVRLEYYDRSNEDRSLPFFGNDDTIREILGTTPHLKADKDEIRAFFEATADQDARTSYIQSIFNNDYTEVILKDGRRCGYKTYQNGLLLWEGSYLSRTKQSFYNWSVIAQFFEAMRMLGELQDTMKPLPSMDGQISMMEAEEQKPSAFTFSQEIIDAVLTRGSNFSEGKLRIYEQFQKSFSAKENADFLKKEYGIGGSSPVIVGSGIGEDHDAKGIRISKGHGSNAPHLDLKWPQVEKRIAELIRLDRYLNPKEMAQYPEWLKRQEQRRAELAEERRNREILSAAPPEEAPTEQESAEYAYHLGDKVYLGANEYEILHFDDERVTLYDTQFPLFNKELARGEFDRKVQENPMNDHLKVTEKRPEEKAAYDLGFGYLGNGLTVWNRAAEVNGDYPTIAHISPEGEVAYYAENLPQSVTERIEKAAKQEKEKNPALPEFYQAYLAIKAETPDSIVLYQMGDSFEAYAEDAKVVAEALDLTQTTRAIDKNFRIAMVGFPDNRLGTYLTMLNDRGYDVTLSSVEDGERSIRSVISDNKEAPVESKPIGRIEYLGSNGKVGESIEYTSPYSFEKDIKEENYYGVPMNIVLYKDGNGNTIPHSFISELDPPPKGFEIIDSPYLTDPALEKAKQVIDAFVREEYQRDEGADYTDLANVGLAYTTTEDDRHEIQAKADLVGFRIETLVDGKVVRTEQYASLEELTEKGLQALSFDDLVYLSEEELTKIEAPITPAWEQPKRSRVQSFDIHPEIPMAERHTFDLASHEVEEVNKRERFHRNYAAISVLKKCQEENRFATPEEQVILSKYVGWGGIPEAFDPGAGSWQTEYQMLQNILTPEEYDSARASTLTAFYTPPAVINGIYKALEQMGFREGNILEPSCGIGNFIGLLPQSMQEAKVYGVEIDTISAGIAQQLYQKSTIAAQGFEEANLPDSFFDAIVGNVPFGDFKVADKRYDKYNFLIHDYFFAKSLDKLRPGGIMALVTSKGTMDKENSAVRRYIAQRAELIGAIRLPNDTFKGNAGTEVVSDILILQKRDRIIDIMPDWVQLDTTEGGIKMNAYFVQHPEMVLGEMKMVSGRFGPEATCVPYEDADLSAQLEEAIANIHGEISEYETEKLTEEDNSIPADPTVRNFSYTVVDDKIYYRENSRMTPVDASATAENRIKGMIRIRDSVRTLLEMQTEDYPDSEIKAEQENLNRLYDAFTGKYGLINSRANVSAFSQDSSYSLLSALEVLDDNGELERKADLFTKRTIKPHKPITSVDSASEALAVSMGEKAAVDMDYMCALTGKTEQEIFADLKGVIFLNPLYGYGSISEPKYLMADEYLSGNVREKLALVRKSAELYPEDYTANVEALEKVQPKDLTASEIFVQLGSTWVPEEIVQQFVFEFLDTPRWAQWNIKVHYSRYTAEWNVEGKSYDRGNVKANSTYGTPRINAYRIIEETLNLKDVRIYDYVEDAEGKKKAILNKPETAIAQAKQELIKQGFQDWVWSDPARREMLCRIYNEKFNSIRPREYDGSHIIFSGMNPEIELREHQKNAVAHILYGGNTLLAHTVGAGKTFEMVAAAMESKRLGLCTKSLFIVPNHLTEQWASEFLQLYPSANILVATRKDFEKKNRRRFCGRIATGDYDAVIIGHSQFEKIPMSIERQQMILMQQIEEITEGIADLKRNRGDRFSVKQLEKTKRSLKLKLDKLNDQSRKDDTITFEELGVDRLFIDESHYYKNLYLYTKMRNVGGITQTEAMKSSDLFMKCRYLDELTGGRGTVFATGTPISNSMVELYTIQRYLQYATLQKYDLQHFDAWAAMYGETVTAIELTPEGTGYRAKTRFARFNNLPELMAMFKEVADIKTADMLQLPVPEVQYHNIAVKPSEIQKRMVESLGERAERIRGGGVPANVDNMLMVTNDGRKLALDQRMIDPLLPDEDGSKVNACAGEVYRIWSETADRRSAQLVFCDLSTPRSDGSFNVYDDIRKKLIARGIPAEEIKFIHEADTEAKKQELFKKVRRGEVRVLIGSTAKMGAGTNVQNKLIASHDLDCPWRPSDLEQRAGRTVRQGNENPVVGLYRYVTEETFDAYLYQLVEGKQKFASQIMTSKSPVRSADDIDETALSYAEIKMLATGNPYIKEKMDLDIQVQRLRLLKSSYLSEIYALEDKIIKHFPQQIAVKKELVAALESDLATAQKHPKPADDRFVGIEVKGVFYSEKAEGGQKIIDACQQMSSPDPIRLGTYRGFDLELSFNTMERTYEVKIRGAASRIISLGTDPAGNITRIDNAVEKISERLEAIKAELDGLEKQFEIAKVEVKKPFAKEQELKEKTDRLNVLNGLLNVDKRDNELADDEPGEVEEAPERKEKGLER